MSRMSLLPRPHLPRPAQHTRRLLRWGALTATLALAATPAAAVNAPAPAPGPVTAETRAAAVAPTLQTDVVQQDLDIPWDVAVLPNGAWLVTERTRKQLLIRRVDGSVDLLAAPARVWAGGETGLMSVVADPLVGENSRFYTCTGWQQQDGRVDVRVLAWQLSADRTSARIVDTLVKGIDITTGRHGGCRLRFDGDGRLYVGTGDAAVGTNPQNLRSLNGKVLRLNRFTGLPAAGNPYVGSPYPDKRYVYTHGHRNVQGLALRPDGRMWSVEHGTYRDDEVNLLAAGGDYGWNPVPGYDESRPMTDFSLPGPQRGARWRSGDPTIATSGAVWVRGPEWGRYEGTLAVAALGGERLLFMRFDAAGQLQWVEQPAAMHGTYGRLRSVVQTANNDLLVTTSNGGGGDVIVRVRPAG